ncbi:septum formation initiator family protein [uncultured Clostridium sp.]|uniref:FtsB family cell division protein n=1 Tax=uncultured Clostridium sp. TaxID=59620 RepID=UPI00261AC7BE|nr:septum formation initiator family protein [uncultured Clostridium sp.]
MKKGIKGKRLVFLIVIVFFAFNFIKQGFVLKEIQKDVVSKQKELQEIKKQNKVLEEKIKIADTDEYIETLARERLDMVKPGEEIIKDKKGDSNSKN